MFFHYFAEWRRQLISSHLEVANIWKIFSIKMIEYLRKQKVLEHDDNIS